MTQTQQHLETLQTRVSQLTLDVVDLTRLLASTTASAAPLDELTDLAMAVDATNIAVGQLAKILSDRTRLAGVNARAARACLAECQLRLELTYSQQPSPELEAVLALVSNLEVPE